MASSTSPRQVHLLVVIHGLWGNPGHVETVEKLVRAAHDARASNNPNMVEFDVLRPETNRDLNSYDGIDWCAERVVNEIQARRAQVESDNSRIVTKFSVFGYSLGGIIARYCIGILDTRGFFKDIEPVNFCTFATPHIGQVTDGSRFRSILRFMGTRLLSRTGEQLFVQDQWSRDGQPLLVALAARGKVFHKALSSFKYIHIYANGVKDLTVPFSTAYISARDPFTSYPDNGVEVAFDSEYTPLLASFTEPSTPPPPPPPKPWYRRMRLPPLPPIIKGPIAQALVYVLLPVLLPVLLSIVIVRFALATRASRRRIKIMEDDKSGEPRLIHMLRELEHNVGDAVVDLFNEPGDESSDDTAPLLQKTSRIAKSSAAKDTRPCQDGLELPPRPRKAGEPILSSQQLSMVRDLNNIPHMKKHIAFIPECRNSHAIIIVRDPKQFPFHDLGRGVIRHWVDGFEF